MREYSLFVSGCSDRFDREMQLSAWHAANIMNMWSKKRIKVDDLLGKKKQDISALATLGSKKQKTDAMLKEAVRARDEARAKRYYGD